MRIKVRSHVLTSGSWWSVEITGAVPTGAVTILELPGDLLLLEVVTAAATTLRALQGAS